MKRNKGVLVLESHSGEPLIEFPGLLMGYSISIDQMKSQARDRGFGEVVFNTSITGYQEILTDPSYFGQIICMTTPHIGNTGINLEDEESLHPWCAGFVVHELTDTPSNWRSKDSLENYLKHYQIPGITGIDTRQLTRLLRSRGVARGIILPWEDRAKAQMLLRELPGFEGRDLTHEVSTRRPYFWGKNNSQSGATRIVAMDFGIKRNMLRLLESHGCEIEVVPSKTSAKEILAREPDGVFLSNGPGDPEMAKEAIETVRNLIGKKPIFGVCMGHQILSLAAGAITYKLKFGHRGGNQPVLDHHTGKVEISSHNHGYAVDSNHLPKGVKITHINLNDHSVEGIEIEDKNAFSVQYHPEACPGPHDSEGLFKRFMEMLSK